MIFTAVSHRHPAHAYPLYRKADFTSTRSITVGPNEVSIRSIARNRYDGSIDALKGPGLSASIPNADDLKNCVKWLDVVQIELSPGPQQLGIIDVQVFHHDTRTLFHINKGLGWQLVAPNIVQVYGKGREVPEEFDLWILARSYPSDELAILKPKIGSKADIAGGTIEIADLTKAYQGWSKDTGFLTGSQESHSKQCAMRLNWQGEWPNDTWREVNVVTRDGRTRFSYNSFSLGFPSSGYGPFHFDVPWEMIDHFELRPETNERAFFFDGLKTLPTSGRKFDPPPSVTRTVDQLRNGTKLEEFAPLSIHARVYRGSEIWPEYNVLLGTHRGEKSKTDDLDRAFTIFVWENSRFYLPFDFQWKDSSGPGWHQNLKRGNANIQFTDSGECLSQVYREPLEEIEAVKFVPQAY